MFLKKICTVNRCKAFSGIWIVVVVVLHLMPTSGIPEVHWMDKIHGDKIIHFFMFFPLGLALKKGFELQSKSVLFALALVAGFLELIQGTILVGRSTDIFDFVADMAGAWLGIVIFKLN